MPPSGAVPKPPGQAVTRHAKAHDFIDVENVAFEGGPDLPEKMSNGMPWPQRTRDKWDVWRAMPHCRLWSAAEWDFALDTIEVAASFHLSGHQAFATELRNREKILGTTLDFRRALRINYVAPKEQTSDDANVTKLDDYRNL